SEGSSKAMMKRSPESLIRLVADFLTRTSAWHKMPRAQHVGTN
ncbi:MAG: hypothetical protein ACI9MR_004268, partial [Myxococcota bacterium]